MKSRTIRSTIAAMGSMLLIGILPADASPTSIEIQGRVTPQFMLQFVAKGDFQIPAVLYFDSAGCLLWSAFGSAVEQSTELRNRLAEPHAPCETPLLPSVLNDLKTEGLPVDAAALQGRPALLWYGSDLLCEPCALAKKTSWPSLVDLVPGSTTKLLLELE